MTLLALEFRQRSSSRYRGSIVTSRGMCTILCSRQTNLNRSSSFRRNVIIVISHTAFSRKPKAPINVGDSAVPSTDALTNYTPDNFMLCIIVLNTCLLALQTSESMERPFGRQGTDGCDNRVAITSHTSDRRSIGRLVLWRDGQRLPCHLSY